MNNFEEYLSLDDKDLENKLSKIDSSDFINYLKICNENTRNDYYKRIENIYGKTYLEITIMAVNHKVERSYKIALYIANILNIIFSSIVCSILFCIFISLPSIIGILYYSIWGFLFSILPQMILEMVINYYRRKNIINLIHDVIISVFFCFIIPTLLFFISTIRVSFTEYLISGYFIYFPILIGGMIFRLIKYIIRKKAKGI